MTFNRWRDRGNWTFTAAAVGADAALATTN